MAPLPSLKPRGPGHHFVLYGDSCSGIPDHPHETTFAAVNATIRRLEPPPEFILFLGDEVAGLTADPDELRAQWRHWLDREMAWLNRETTELWHTTGNHITYGATSEAIFRDILDMPHNGPPGTGRTVLLGATERSATGLRSHPVQRSRRRGPRRDRLAPLGPAPARRRLSQAGDRSSSRASGQRIFRPYQREIGPEHAKSFWDTLVQAGVTAYLCSHILAFDVQVHRGVLQICSAGAGTAHRMPEGFEYLHAVQAVLDTEGLRYQVLDIDGQVRERLSWPVALPPDDRWCTLHLGESDAPVTGNPGIVAFRFTGRAAPPGSCAAQTLVAAFQPGIQATLWIGLRGPEQRLSVILGPEPRRSPHYWIGPTVSPDTGFEFQLLIHTGMGPGGVMCRFGTEQPWSSLAAASPWGAERLSWPDRWSIGHGQGGNDDRAFLGSGLSVLTATC